MNRQAKNAEKKAGKHWGKKTFLFLQNPLILKYKWHLFVIFLTTFYFAIGLYLIFLNNPTVDEFLHFGASTLYAHGLGGNNEHPLFLKWLISLNLHHIPAQIDENQTEHNSSFSAISYSGLHIFHQARFIVLFFNFLPLIYFFSFLFSRKNIITNQKPITALFLLILIFSPAFYAHNYLVTFDVSAAFFAFATVISGYIFYKKIYENIQNKFFSRQILTPFFVFTLFLTIAINVKFSNVILLILPFFGLFFSIYQSIKFSKKNCGKNAILASLFGGIFSVFFTVLLSYLSFKNIPVEQIPSMFQNDKIPHETLLHHLNSVKNILPDFLDNFLNGVFVYVRGLIMTLMRSKDFSHPLIFGEYIQTNFLDYALKIFTFKETLAVIFLTIFSIFIFFKNLIKTIKSKHFFKPTAQTFFLFFFIFTPIIYVITAFQSTLLIGYRHFYTVLIFIYFLISLAFIRHFKHQILSIFIYILIPVLGVLGISQNLQYLNQFAQTKTFYFNDSTYNWGQRAISPIHFALKNQYLNENNYQNWAQYTFLTDYSNSVWNVYYPEKEAWFEKMTQNATQYKLWENLVENSSFEYIIIDSDVLQILKYNDKNPDSIAQKNLEFIKKNGKIIYSVPNLIYIIKLEK